MLFVITSKDIGVFSLILSVLLALLLLFIYNKIVVYIVTRKISVALKNDNKEQVSRLLNIAKKKSYSNQIYKNTKKKVLHKLNEYNTNDS